jgi:hypothetical protein
MALHGLDDELVLLAGGDSSGGPCFQRASPAPNSAWFLLVHFAVFQVLYPQTSGWISGFGLRIENFVMVCNGVMRFERVVFWGAGIYRWWTASLHFHSFKAFLNSTQYD